MVFTFSLFKNDIDNFSNEDYYKNNENFTDFFCFLDFYKDIINDDNKKPVFIQSTKNKKNNNSNQQNSKGYKYFKINREQEEINNKKGWCIKNFIKDDEKNIVFIKTTLNKISDETYEVISNELLNEIYKMDYDESIFEILTHEIINKCIYEYKYRKLYINLCSKIWNDIDFHKKIFFVEKDETDKYFYVNKNTGENSNKLFNTIESLYEHIFINNNFKKYFVNNLKNIIYGFDNTYFITDELTEEEVSKKKKYYLGIFDIVNVLFVEKYISIDVINILITKLLHLNDTFEMIQSLEYEALYNIVKLMNNTVFNFSYYGIFYKEIINYCKQIIESNNLSKRNLFFLSEIIELLNKFITYDNIQNSKKTWSNTDNKKIVKDNFKNNNFKACKEIINKSNDNDIINSLLLFIIEQKNISSDTIKFLNELNVKDVEKEFYILCNNINDILLDIPNANIKFIKLFNELNITKKNNILLMLENITDDDYSDDE
jgi:hypothetical protein